jgi:hypothetical protein
VKGLSTRAEPLTASGQNCWPPTGSYVTAYGQDLMAADRRGKPGGTDGGTLRNPEEHLVANGFQLPVVYRYSPLFTMVLVHIWHMGIERVEPEEVRANHLGNLRPLASR